MIDFPPTVINTNSDKMLMITNNSTETLRIATIDIAAPFSVNFPGPSPLPITVNGGASASIPLRFTPTSIGSHTGRITLRESSEEILLTVNLTGQGVQNQPPPVISSFTPSVVSWDDSITVTGQYFTTATMVKIGNMEVDYTVESDTQILINTEGLAGRIPENYSIEDNVFDPPNGTGAFTGYIKVTTVFGMATSATTVRIIFTYPE